MEMVIRNFSKKYVHWIDVEFHGGIKRKVLEDVIENFCFVIYSKSQISNLSAKDLVDIIVEVFKKSNRIKRKNYEKIMIVVYNIDQIKVSCII